MLQQHTVDKLVDLLVQHPIRNILVVARWREVEYANPRDKDRTGNERERDRSRYILLFHGIHCFNI